MELLYPRIKPHFSLIAHSADEVEFRSGVWDPRSFLIEDQLQQGKLLEVISLIDGKHTISRIAERVNLPKSVIDQVIENLGKANVVENSASTALDYYLEEQARATQPSISPPLIKKVTLLGDKALCQGVATQLLPLEQQHQIVVKTDCEKLNEQLAGSDWLHHGVKFEQQLLQFEHWQQQYIIYLSSAPNPHTLLKLNKVLHALKRPWLPAVIDGPFLFIGPTFTPPMGPCYECLEKRLAMNVRDSQCYQEYKNAIANDKIMRESDLPIISSVQQLLISHVSLEAINFLLTTHAFTQSRVLSIYLPTMEILFNRVLRYNNCSTCGGGDVKHQQKLHFEIGELIGRGDETKH